MGRGAGCVAGNVDDVGVFGCSVRYVSRVVSCVCVCVLGVGVLGVCVGVGWTIQARNLFYEYVSLSACKTR